MGNPHRRELLFDNVYLKNTLFHLSTIKCFKRVRATNFHNIIIIFAESIGNSIDITHKHIFYFKIGDIRSKNYCLRRFSIEKDFYNFKIGYKRLRKVCVINNPEKIEKSRKSMIRREKFYYGGCSYFFILKRREYRIFFINMKLRPAIFRKKIDLNIIKKNRTFESVNKYIYSIFVHLKIQKKRKFFIQTFTYENTVYDSKIYFYKK